MRALCSRAALAAFATRTRPPTVAEAVAFLAECPRLGATGLHKEYEPRGEDIGLHTSEPCACRNPLVGGSDGRWQPLQVLDRRDGQGNATKGRGAVNSRCGTVFVARVVLSWVCFL